MKKSKILAPALAILCLSTAASVTGTVAWFAANNIVTVNGMNVQSTLPSSLAINDTYNPIGQETSITLTSPEVDLNPVSHWHGSEDANGGMYRVTNGQDVNPDTGLEFKIGDMRNGVALTAEDTINPLEFEIAPAAQHYVDFTVYIGSVGNAITLGAAGYLRAQVTFSGNQMTATNLATTVDFYSSTGPAVTSPAYKGCVNAAGVSAEANHGAYVEHSGDPINTVDVLSGGDVIPVSTSTTDAVKVLMRVYYDGALQDSATSTYVATNSVVTEQVNIDVVFSLNRANT